MSHIHHPNDVLRTRDLLLELVDNIPVAAVVIDGDSLYCNAATEKLTGYARSEVATFTEWLENIFQADHAAVRERFDQDRVAGFPVPVELTIICKDGSRRIVEFTAAGRQQVFCVLHDVTERVMAEQKIRESETLLREAQRVGNLGVFDYDIAADNWISSREMDGIFGIDAGFERTFTSWLTIIHPECRSEMELYFKTLLLSKRWFDMEYRIIRPSDGQVCWVYGTGEFICDAAGKPARMIGTIQDITEQKLTEGKLVASEAKYHNLFDSATDAIFVLDLKGGFIDVNRVAHTRLGYTKEELLGVHISQLDPPEFAALVPGRLQMVREKGGAVFESAHRRRDGSLMPVEINCRLNEYEGRQVYFSVVRDITERKEAERLLRESEERYRRFSNLTTDYVYSCTRSGNNPFRILWMAGAVEDITGYSMDDIMTMGCWMKIVHPVDVPRVSGLLLALAPGDRQSEEFRIVRKDGAVRWIRESCSCERGASSGELVLFGTSRDITVRKNAEAEVAALNEHLERLVKERTADLERSNEDLSSFCYAVSHELRAPIARLQGFSSILGELCTDSSETLFMTSRIENASRQLQSVVDSILMLSRFSRMELSLQEVDLSLIAKRKLDLLLAENPDRRVELLITPGVKAVADPGLLDICLDNLLVNAFKYTGQTPDARIEFGVWSVGREEVFFVRDNGAGFDMTYSEKLYAPFQRLHQHKEFPGTGIGLATVKRIIERHGGTIWAESGVGQGATFFFTLGHSG